MLYARDILTSKRDLYKQIPQERLMEYYLKIKPTKGLFCSPLRKDKNPGCSFYKSPDTGILYFCDWAKDLMLDCIGVVMYKYNLNYYRALRKIQLDVSNMDNTELPVEEFTQSSKVIQVKAKEWDEQSLSYWKKHFITLDTLDKYNVFNVSHVYINKLLAKRATKTNPIYSYHFPSTDRIKIYRPLTRKPEDKWLSSSKCDDISGWEYYSSRKHTVLFITSSCKDAMVLHELGFPAIAPITENVILPEDLISYIKTRYRFIVMFMDNDDAGMKSNFTYAEKYKLPYVFIPLRYGVKDISEFILKFKKRKTDKLVKKLLTNCFSVSKFPF